MDDLRTRARLVDLDRAGTIGTVVTRAEIADAAAGTEFPATLLLELDRAEAHATVAVDWDQETLEQLLASAEDQEIELWFDERELAVAFDDVEAHGIRQRAAVLAVAAAAAGMSTSPAFARLAPGTGGPAIVSPTAGGAANPYTGDDPLAGDRAAFVASRGAERALEQDRKVSANLGNASVASTGSDTTLSTGELAGVVSGGALLIAAAGFGVARKRTPPVRPV
jgi:hypothetical protein